MNPCIAVLQHTVSVDRAYDPAPLGPRDMPPQAVAHAGNTNTSPSPATQQNPPTPASHIPTATSSMNSPSSLAARIPCRRRRQPELIGVAGNSRTNPPLSGNTPLVARQQHKHPPKPAELLPRYPRPRKRRANVSALLSHADGSGQPEDRVEARKTSSSHPATRNFSSFRGGAAIRNGTPCGTGRCSVSPPACRRCALKRASGAMVCPLI